jgi:hypothetical protein
LHELPGATSAPENQFHGRVTLLENNEMLS